MKNKKLLMVGIIALLILCVLTIVLCIKGSKDDDKKNPTSAGVENNIDKPEADQDTHKDKDDSTHSESTKTEILNDDSSNKGPVLTAPSDWEDSDNSQSTQGSTNQGIETKPDESDKGTDGDGDKEPSNPTEDTSDKNYGGIF